MKKIVIMALMATMLAGCVKQEDYDALYKDNTKLEKKVERLEADNSILEEENDKLKGMLNSLQNDQPTEISSRKDNFTVEDIHLEFTNKANNETISLKLTQDSVPVMEVDYNIPEYIDDISTYERKVTWFVTEMVDCAKNKGFTVYDITALTPDEPNRCLSASFYEGDVRFWGHDINGDYTDDPDWFLKTCGDFVSNDFDDIWIMETALEIYKTIDINTH